MDMGIGVDVVNIERIASLSQAVRERLFHPLELEQASHLPLASQAEFLAGRFAAKEALGKALGTGLAGFSLKDIWVERQENGKPVFHFQGKAKELVGQRNALLSISHDRPVAVAMVVLQGGGDGSF